MAATLTYQSKLALAGSYNAGNTGDTLVSALNAGAGGVVNLPDYSLTYGTTNTVDSNGNVYCNDWYVFKGTIAAGATKSIDLTGGSDTNPFGTALAFATIRYFAVGILAPDGIISVQVGPRGVSNAWQGPWGGVGATVYETVNYVTEHRLAAAGIAVTAGTGDLFLVKNPGGADLTAWIFIAGTK